MAQAAVVGVVCRQVLDFAFEAFQMTLFFIAAQLGESGIDQLTPFVLDSLFLPDRHESGFGPTALQFFQFVESLFLSVRDEVFHLFDQRAFFRQVLFVLGVDRCEVGRLALEKTVAGRAEPFPHRIRMAACDRPDLFPPFL